MSLPAVISRTFSSEEMECQRKSSQTRAGAPTLLVIRLLEPTGVKKPLWKNLVPSIDDQRLSANNDVDQNELLELLLPKVANL